MAEKKYFTKEEKKLAQKENYKKWYENHKTERKAKDNKRRREYYQNHKEERLLYAKEYRENHKEKGKKYNKNWRTEHKQEIKIKRKEYYQNHKEERNKYTLNKLKNNINFKIANNLRNRLRQALKDNQKSGSAVKDLGCSIPELKTHLESKFQDGMTWDNWSPTGWHIDHIKPLASFNLINRKEFLKANHYTNLQPMWAEENFKKGKNAI
jgi:hypothetical protein